jgi:hypothetical protein
VTGESAWDHPETRNLGRRACYDCHSNETTWPWYSNLAPMSWLLQRHVNEGRRELSFSTWDRSQRGEMPTRDFELLHLEARLSAADREALVQGLSATIGAGSTGRR